MTADIVKNNQLVLHPEIFRGQYWDLSVIDYYTKVEEHYLTLKARQCDIKYLRNETHDAYLSILSPFERYQRGPFNLSNLLPELESGFNLIEKIAKDQNIIILDTTHDKRTNSEKGVAIPRGYLKFDIMEIPNMNFPNFIGSGYSLFLLVPKKCVARNIK